MFKILFIFSLILLIPSVSFAQVSSTSNSSNSGENVSYPAAPGSTFAPVTVTPALPPVNAAAVAQAESSTASENNAASAAVTSANTQVNSIESTPQTQQDLNAQAGMDTSAPSTTVSQPQN